MTEVKDERMAEGNGLFERGGIAPNVGEEIVGKGPGVLERAVDGRGGGHCGGRG